MYYIIIHVFSHFKDGKNERIVEFLLAEGMVVKVPHNNYGWMIIECAAPILRNIIFSRIHGPTIKPSSSPIDTTNIDPEWLLTRTIEVYSCSKLFIVNNISVCIYLLRSTSFYKEHVYQRHFPINTLSMLTISHLSMPFKLNFSVFTNN